MKLLFAVVLILIIIIVYKKYNDKIENYRMARVSQVELQTHTDYPDDSRGFLRANFSSQRNPYDRNSPGMYYTMPENVAKRREVRPRGGNWSPWRHERGNTWYYWYDAPHKSPGYECLDACYHRYDRVGCTNACRNVFNI